MIDKTLLVLQNAAGLERVHLQGRCNETCPASSQDAYQAISIKAEVLSDAETEEDPLANAYPGIKVEPQVSCDYVCKLGGFHKYKYPSFYKHSIYELWLH
jgi:hypothetical protein